MTYKLNFPEQDKLNSLKKFPELEKMELIINISIVYFMIFLVLMALSFFDVKYNLPALGGLGMLIVIFFQTIAYLNVSRILRQYT